MPRNSFDHRERESQSHGMTLSPKQLATHLNGEVLGDESVVICGACSTSAPAAGTVTFAEKPKHLEEALKSVVSAVITSAGLVSATRIPPSKAVIVVKNPRAAFARALGIFFPAPSFEPGVHPTAVIAGGVELGDSVHVGAYAVIKAGARIGARSAIDSGATIGVGVVIGEECVIHPRVTLYPGVLIGNRVFIHAGAVIGSDGFGYVTEGGQHVKIPQVGNVVIEDDVEIGANTTIDRATLGSTVIKRGTKIDNLVQIAHNNTVGEHCLIAGQAGLAGSVTLGKYVMLAGQVGVADHKTIGDQAIVGGGGVVITDIPSKAVVWGFPARAHREALREIAALRRLPGIIRNLTAAGLTAPESQKEAAGE